MQARKIWGNLTQEGNRLNQYFFYKLAPLLKQLTNAQVKFMEDNIVPKKYQKITKRGHNI